MADQTRNLKNLEMVLLHIRETELTAMILSILHDAQKNGESYGVDELHIGKINHQLLQPVVEVLPAFLLEAYGPDVVDVSSGCYDGHILD